jgi:8-oxo-dGTP pyrophosphatase MutT (NUDIX family)
MSIKPWKILESTYLRKKIRLDKCELPNGKILEPIVFEFQTWVAVLALTKNQEVLLIKQYRHGIQDVIWEFPGGVVDEGESPLEGVRRELLEETGYTTDKIIEVGKFFPDPSLQSNKMYAFLALDVEKVAIQHLDDAEEIEVCPTPLEEVVRMAKEGELSNALQVAVLFYALAYMDCIG